jgi:transposase
MLARDCDNMTDLTRVRLLHKVSSGLLYQVFYEQCEVKLRERRNQIWPEVIGIDEHFFKREKRQTQFVTMFTDIRKRRLFEVAHGKQTNLVLNQVETIPGRENVRIVVIDMSDTYRALVKKLFPNAQIVADKFHVLRLLSPALIKTRRQIHGHRQDLQWRRLILRNETDLEYFQRCDLKKYLQKHPVLEELHRIKERLHLLYRTRGFRKAIHAFEKLIESMQTSSLPEIQRLKRTLLRWRNPILLYFEKRYTNALTEALNGRGKLLQRRASGYKSFRNYRVRLLSACGF